MLLLNLLKGSTQYFHVSHVWRIGWTLKLGVTNKNCDKKAMLFLAPVEETKIVAWKYFSFIWVVFWGPLGVETTSDKQTD